MKEVIKNVQLFKSQFTAQWKARLKKRERIQGYIFEVHMVNILIIFKNYKVKI